MCAIVGSFNKDKLAELIELNSKRGSFSYSFCVLDMNYDVLFSKKDFGKFDNSLLEHNYGTYVYYIAHIQAPTGGLIQDVNRIHPAIMGNKRLWHNGIIKDYYVKKMMVKYDSLNEWDTTYILTELDNIEDIDGTFSCLLLDEGKSLTLFRNSDSPMFIDDSLNISSTKFKDSYSTQPYSFIDIDLKNKNNKIIKEWISKHSSPYFFIKKG